MRPGWTSRAVQLLVRRRIREEIAGDLDELFALRAARDGIQGASCWYCRQAIRAVLTTTLARRTRTAHAGGDSMMQTLVQDVRYGLRLLRKQPAFTVTAILMLALGIGTNATIFSWINTVLLNPLPGAAHAQDVVQLSYVFRGDPLPAISYPDYRDLRKEVRAFSDVAVRDDLAVGIAIDRDAERAWAEIVSANYFDVLGVAAWRGRTLQPADDEPGAPAVAVISHAYWVSRFAAADEAVGRSVRINAQPFTIVGVAAPGFMGGVSSLQFDLWIPVGTQPALDGRSRLDARGSRWLGVLARRAPGVSLEQARAEFSAFVSRLASTYGGFDGFSGAVYRLSESPVNGGVGVLRPVLLILMSVALIVLLIACANLAGLLLARAAARQRELAIRLSVGAGRSRLVRQLLIEAALLAVAGLAAALLALRWTAGLLISFAPPSELPITMNVTIDARVVAFTAAAAGATLLLFALIPAWQATRTDVTGTLREGASASRGKSRHRLRRGLVAAQVALSTVLLVCAGLCLRSLSTAQAMTPGFDADGIIIGWADLSSAPYSDAEARTFYTRMLERLRALPGVEAATMARRIPLSFTGVSSSNITVEGSRNGSDTRRFVNVNYVGPDYLRTMRIPLLAGRDISGADLVGQPPVAIVTEATARTYWPDVDAVGRRFAFGSPTPGEERWITVIGVAQDIKQRSLTERGQPAVWLPVLQSSQPGVIVHVRAAGPLAGVSADLSRVMRQLDPNVTFYGVSPLAEQVKAATFQQRLAANLLAVFGALALTLAAVGSYGVLSYLVGQRRREIGIRLAVGASPRSVFRLIVSNGARTVALGAAIGLLLSLAAGTGLRSLLIGVQPLDPTTYAVVTTLLVAVALAACALPARRAAAVDPAITLRDE